MKRWLAATTAAAAGFLFVWEQVQATRLGFELDRARRCVQEARGRTAHLRLELERRTAPAELASLARERLGMVPPSPDSLVILAQAAARPLEAPAALPRPRAAGLTVAAAAAETLAPAGAGHVLRSQLLSWLRPPEPDAW
ncbi:MAG: cell division protein FtsL [Elusimicrobia bacterium]|nr:cell division protein FtsL [Elusimicrobiota bacterium]